MKKLLLLSLAVIAFAAAGCISIHNNKGTSANLPAAEVRPAQYQAITQIGDAPVSGEVKMNILFWFLSWGVPATFADNTTFTSASNVSPLDFMDPYTALKKSAAYRTCEANNCDSLMDARYVITTKDYFIFATVTCKVTGIPVKVTGYKLIEKN